MCLSGVKQRSNKTFSPFELWIKIDHPGIEIVSKPCMGGVSRKSSVMSSMRMPVSMMETWAVSPDGTLKVGFGAILKQLEVFEIGDLCAGGNDSGAKPVLL